MPERRVLLVWPYDREAFVRPFAALAEHGALAFTYLYNTSPARDETVHARDRIEYWENFSSAQAVLDRLDPAAIVFRGLSSPRPIALNVIAKSRGISTYILNHGVIFSAEDARAETLASNRHRSAHRVEAASFVQEVSGSTGHGISFMRASLRGRHLTAVPPTVAYTVLTRYGASPTAIEATGHFPARLPSAYLCHSLHNARIARDLCDATVPQALLGNPEYDDYFRAGDDDAPPAADEGYYLFVDSIMAAPELLIAFMTAAQTTSVYERVARFAARKGKKLVVKLHPLLPESTLLPRHLENVEWVRQADLTALIRGATACFGYFSTLLLSAAWKKQVCFLEHFPLSVLDEARATGMVDVVDARTFDPDTFELAPRTRADREAYEKLFFWRADGRATERLGAVLSRGLGARAEGLEILLARAKTRRR